MDSFSGFGGSDTLNMQAATSFFGGFLTGGSGNNTFNFAGNLTSNYFITGGAGTNTINLDGNTTATLSFVSNIQTINMAGGFSYDLALADGAIDPSGQTLTINASALGAADSLSFDAAIIPIAGNLVITGGAGNDTFDRGTGTGNESFDGGSGGFDQVVYTGNYASYVVTDNADGSVTVSKPGGGTDTLKHIEQLVFADDTVPVGTGQPWIVSVAASAASGAALGEGKTVTFTVTMNEAVTVNTSGGAPTLSLNDSEVASYTGGSGTNTLSFSYVVQPNDNVNDLEVTGLTVPTGSAIESGGIAAALTNAHEDTGVTINTIPPNALDAEFSRAGTSTTTVLGIGTVVTVMVDMNEAVTVNSAGGLPTVTLNDDEVATYAGGSGTSRLNFTYTVQKGDFTTDLQVTGLIVPTGSSLTSQTGNAAVIDNSPSFWSSFGNSFLEVDGSGPTDFNLSGSSDLLWQNSNGTPAIWTMNGASTLSAALVGSDPGTTWHIVGSGDFNNDGHADIAWQNNDGSVAIWEMNGTNVISSGILSLNPGPTWHIVGTGDFAGNGTSDLLWQNTNGTVAIWEMNGLNVTFANTISNNPGPTWHAVGTGDFNGDGKADVLFQNDNGSVAIWETGGFNVTASAIVGSNPGPTWHVVGSGDFFGNGDSDILWQNNDGSVAIWEMNGLNVTATSIIGNNPGSAWHIVGVGDYNGDGKDDILFQNTDGEAAIWEMNGFTVVSASLVGNPGSTWHLQGDGGAAFQIGAGVPVALGARPPGAGLRSTGEGPSSKGHFGIFAPALPVHGVVAR